MRQWPERGLGDARHAERPAREVDPVGGHDLGHHGEAERADGEAVLGQAEHRHADRERGERRPPRTAARSAARERPARLGGEQGRRVGADAEEGGVGERQAAHVADHQVVAEGERREERGEDQDVQDVALLARARRRPRSTAPRRARRPRRSPARRAHGQMPIRRPKSPCGRHEQHRDHDDERDGVLVGVGDVARRRATR